MPALWEYINPVVALNDFLIHRAFPDAFKEPPKASEPTFTVPRATEGSPVPIVYGKTRIRTPALVWADNFFKPGETIVAGSFGTYVANHYSADMLFVIGVPFNGGTSTLLRMFAGDAPVSMAFGTATGPGSRTIPFDGGPIPPGVNDLSFSGVFWGGVTFQDVTDNVAAGSPRTGFPGISPAQFFADGVFFDNALPLKTPSPKSAMTYSGLSSTLVPGYRNQIAAFVHVALGAQPSIPAIGFEVAALSTGSESDVGDGSWLANTDDADPAAVIFDLLTSSWSKVGIPLDRIDRASFDTASNTLFAEGHGYSAIIDQGTDAWSAIGEVLKQINGVLYCEPTTGLVTLRLIRAVDPTGVPDINPDNCDPPADNWYQIQGWDQLPNRVRLMFTDRANNYASTPKLADNPGGVALNGGKIRAITIQYPGCCTETLARQLAGRELASVSRPIVRATVKVGRSFHTTRIGDVVTLTWPTLGAVRMPMRVGRVGLGRPGASRIELDLITDMFSGSTAGAY